MSLSRVLGVLIGAVLVAAVATAIVKGGDETAPAPSAQAPTEEPSTNFTTLAPTFLTQSPVVPTSGSGTAAGAQTSAPTLPRTGDGSFAPQAALLLLLALAGGFGVWRTARRPSS